MSFLYGDCNGVPVPVHHMQRAYECTCTVSRLVSVLRFYPSPFELSLRARERQRQRETERDIQTETERWAGGGSEYYSRLVKMYDNSNGER